MAEVAPMQHACPWHAPLLERLLSQHGAGQLPHALLLAGPAGTGKWRLARALAEALLCRSPMHGLACGACQECHLAAAGTHPDLFVAEPEEAGKAIKVDQIRDLVSFCSRTPQYGGPRLALLGPAEAMNRNAQNALLKTLEEPGEDTLLLLVSHQPGQLLATVRSRCQRVLTGRPSRTVALDWLAPQVGEGKRAEALLDAAADAPLTALALDASEWYASRERLVGQCLAVVEGRTPASLAAPLFAAAPTLEMLEALQRWAHAGLRWLATGVAPADEQLAQPLTRLARRLGPRRLLAFAEAVTTLRRAVGRGGNPNRELMFEQLLLVLAGVTGETVG